MLILLSSNRLGIIKKVFNMDFLREINVLYRITDWLPFLGFALIGFFLKVSRLEITNLDPLLLVLFFSSLLLSYTYSLNDYFDENKKQKYFLLPLISSLILLPFLNFNQILLAVIFLFLFTLYSLRGVSLSKIPIVGTLTNTVGFMSIFMIGYMAKEKVTLLGIIFFLLLSVYQTVSQLIHEKVHLKSDIESGRRTSVFYLRGKLVLLLKAMLLFTFPLSLFLLLKTRFNLFAIACILFSLIFFIKVSQIDKNLRKSYKLASIVVGLFFLLDYFLIYLEL